MKKFASIILMVVLLFSANVSYASMGMTDDDGSTQLTRAEFADMIMDIYEYTTQRF